MRNPLRDESAAFQLVLVTVAAFAVIVLASWIDTWLGVAVSALLVLAAIAAIRRGLASRGRPAGSANGRSGASADPAIARLLLVLSPDGADDEELLRRGVAGAVDGGAALVVVPALDTDARTWSAAREQVVATAEARLAAAVTALGEAGLVADGRLGSLDVERAVDDAVRAFAPTVAIVTGRIDASASARVAERLGLS